MGEAELRAEDVAACRRILKRGSGSFTAASRLLPRRVRDGAAVIYAFCRMADDAIDAAGAEPDALDGLRRRLDRIYGSAPVVDPVERAFATVARACGIPRAIPEALLEGFLWDVEGRRCSTLAETRAYCVRVASAVGLMMSLLMGVRDRRALARACDLGVAMQLTNIARDVGEDARAGRVYLPLEWLREVGIDPESWLAAPRFTPELGTVVLRLLVEADRLYALSDAGIAVLPPDCRAAIRAARLIYAEIGSVIRARGLDSVSSRAASSTWRKLRLLQAARREPRSSRPQDLDHPALDEARALIALAAPDEPGCMSEGPALELGCDARLLASFFN